ncbi:nitrite reductase [Pectobacterium parmentieri]|uniref:Nitrite reductase [NAD(P)H], large subunit n=4 Tax=Pectobacterium parmentieri TaxID=1905730 RepID=A0A0H3I6H4_PECPM|nr:Nitrite reductase [NAD(P)H], large subunit [Pectobacterium parmentieri]POW28407.1 nitrite reductase (NAD(P)H) small subunit [Pectobacterium parmentieri]
MMKPHLIVIGNGMASARFVDVLRQLAATRYRITVIGDEPRASYNRILLSPVLSGEKAFTDTLLTPAAIDDDAALPVNTLLGERVTHIDRQAREVTTTQRQLHYDHLVLATGSTPFMPPMPGIDLAGVCGFRTLDDVELMLATIRQPVPAVVIGGGLLGIEAAAALKLRGADVTLLHRVPILMERQLDAMASDLLCDSLRARGIACETDVQVVALHGDTHGVTAVALADGRTIPAGLVVVTAGVTPASQLARECGLPCNRGVLVDGQLQTADPYISAIGECCELNGEIVGLVAPCFAHATLVAQRLAGHTPQDYQREQATTRLKVTGIGVVSGGDINVAPNDEVYTTFDPQTQHYRRLLLRDGRLCGVLLYGDTDDSSRLLAAMESTTEGEMIPPASLLFGLSSPDSDSQPQAVRIPVMSKPILVVVGHGMVGHYFLEQLVERDLHQHYHIVVFGEERHEAYDRVHLSEYFSGRSAASLSLVKDGFFAESGIELRSASEIVAIDRERQCVCDALGRETAYDKLVLATGSYAFVPPIPGNTRPGCLVYRTLDDLDAIAAQAKKATSGVVIGGGLLGLEAANALRQLGLDTHVVEFAPRLMAVQLDDGGASMLRRKIEALGVQIHVSKETREIIDGEQALHRLCFADGSVLETDLVLFSAGIRPRDKLADSCDLEKGPRGGIVIDDRCQTSDDAIFAIGECALWKGQIFGLVAPGYQMARSVADTLAQRDTPFTGADMSTKLKLLGVEVASIGDAHGRTAGSQSYQWTDGPNEVYKKIVVSADGKHLLGAVLIGDSSDYSTLLQMMLNDMPLPAQPEGLILPARSGDAPKGLGVAALPASAQICSCHNVSKSDISTAVAGGCGELGALKTCTKAGTGCGGCVPLLKQVMEYELTQLGVEVKKDICEHFAYSRQELYHLIRVHEIRSFDSLLERYGHGLGCEVCKPLVGSMLASCWNDYLLQPQHLPLQDTNDRFFANIQKDGTYSVVPRVPAGEITPAGLIAIGQVAQRYNLYTKITGGQRVDLFGARLEQLPAIWRELIDAGFETGHAYGKSLRTVKSCVGSTWCRYGVQDSTGLAIQLEHRYKGLRSPHKVKMAVSGCTRECAEAQSKDIGVIATDKGWNLYVCGNGGMKPRHADLFASDLDTETLLRTIDRVLMFYIRTGDRLQRTSTWMDNLEGGIDYLRQVILEDSLNIGEELDKEMQRVVEAYQCEWQTTLESPERLALFRGFLNSDSPDEAVVMVPERGQIRPAHDDEKVISPAPVVLKPAVHEAEWVQVATLGDIPRHAGMAARLGQQQIALFHLPDSEQQVYALENHEPGSGANVLSRGLIGDVAGEPVVISPLYKKRFKLRDGVSTDDSALYVRAWPVRVENDEIWVCRQPLAVPDSVALADNDMAKAS